MRKMQDHHAALASMAGRSDEAQFMRRLSVRQGTVIIAGMPFVSSSCLLEEYLQCIPYCRAHDLALYLFCCNAETMNHLQNNGVQTPGHAPPLAALKIGEMPKWKLSSWRAPPHKSIRLQINRAARAGVMIEHADASTIGEQTRRELHDLMQLHIRKHKLLSLGWVAKQPTIDQLADYDALLIARHAERIVAIACMRYLASRRCLYLEHLFRRDHAPNGMTELLLNYIANSVTNNVAQDTPHGHMTWADDDIETISLGLSALAAVDSVLLRACVRLGSWIYPFAGIHKFRQRLHPDCNESMYLLFPDYLTRVEAIYRLLRAFY